MLVLFGGSLSGQMMAAVEVAEVSGEVFLPPDDPVWSSATPVTLALSAVDYVEGGGMRMGPQTGDIVVRAIHNDTWIAFLLEWEDPTKNDTITRPEDFGDHTAIQFVDTSSGGDMMTDICMGDLNGLVNIWFWHSHNDMTENIIAGGVGTITSTGEKNILALSSWSATGGYKVVMARTLANATVNQVELWDGLSTSIAFGTWDGNNRERDGKKSVTDWTQLNV